MPKVKDSCDDLASYEDENESSDLDKMSKKKRKLIADDFQGSDSNGEIDETARKKAEKKARKKEKRMAESIHLETPTILKDINYDFQGGDSNGEIDETARKKAEKKARKKEKRMAESINLETPTILKDINYETAKTKSLLDTTRDCSDSLDEIHLKKKKNKLNTSAELLVGHYLEHELTKNLSLDEVNLFRSQHSIQLHPEEASTSFKPITNFQYLRPSLGNYCEKIWSYIESKGFSTPSPIQSQCWPPLLAGRDCIGIAATGSGKTLAFLIPALLQLAKISEKKSAGQISRDHGASQPSKPRMLILSPTRELAMQSHQVVTDIGESVSACIYGGVPKGQQKAALRNADIVVATPGRLQDFMDERVVDLSNVSYLVLDEADRMLDDGFEPAIRKILGACPSAQNGRQTVMFSATWPDTIRALAETFLKSDVIRVIVGSEDLAANHRVTQIVECIDGQAKQRKLFELLGKYHKSRTNRCLIFVLYKKEAVTVLNSIQSRGFNVTAIHGDMNQSDRTEALEQFKSGRIPLLIATDVAARGLDIPNVEYVINYSFPLTVEDYVHRIGRTGRGGASGISHTFFTDFDKGLAGGLVAVLQDANQEVPKEIYKYPMVTKKKSSKLYGDFGPKQELMGKKSTKIVFDDDNDA